VTVDRVDPLPPLSHSGDGTLKALRGLFAAELILVLSSGLAPTTFVVHAIAAGRSPAFFGALGALYSVGVFIAYVLGPVLLARLSFRRIGFVAAPLLVAGVLSGLIPNPEIWLVGRLLIGLGIGLFFLTTEAWIGVVTSGPVKVRALARYGAVIYGSFVVAQLVLLVIHPTTDGPILISAVAAIVGFLVLARVEKPKSPAPTVENPFLGAGLIIRHAPESMFMTLASGLLVGASGSFGPAYAVSIGLPREQVSLLLLSTMVGAVIAQPFFGRMANRFGARQVLIGMALITIVASLALFNVVAWSWQVACLAAVWGSSGSTGYAIGASIAHAGDHGRHPVEVARIALILNGVGGIIGPIFCAVLVSHLGPAGIYIFAAIVAILVALAMISALISRRR
jgi:MFS family permease